MKTKLIIAAALMIVATSINVEAQRRRTDESANRPAGEPDRRRTDAKTETKPEERRNEVRQVQKNEEVHATREKVVYKKSPRVEVVRVLPNNYHRFRHRDYDYYENDGVYYNFNNGKYIVIAPPIGMRVRYLPFRNVRIYQGDRLFFYYNGVFYSSIPNDDEYEIIEPPIGAVVNELPFDANKVEIDEQIYYEYNNTLYKKIRTEYGKAYEVVGKL